MSIDRYVFVDRNNQEGDHEFESLDDAIANVPADHAIIERQYTFSDSELVWTPDGSSTWPTGPVRKLRRRTNG